MRKTLAALAITAALVLSASPAMAEPPQPSQSQVQNFGQCMNIMLSLGINPSEIRPPVLTAGPAVILFDKDGNEIRKIVGSQAYDFRVACHFEPPLPD